MKLNDERRKVLTEYLGECWHETFGELQKDTMFFTCQKCGKEFHFADTEIGIQRTFDTDAAMMALFRKMVDEEELDNFLFWCSVTHFNFPPKIEKLFYKPERFCNLVAKWLEEMAEWLEVKK